MSPDPNIARIHNFWYSRSPREWFMPPEGLDQQCRTEFADLVQDARAGKLDHWQAEPDGTLAILVLLDQFSRNVYRGTPDAFSADPKALDIATRAIAKGWHRNASVAHALTYYLPLMHNESLLAQIACRALLEQMVANCEPDSEDRIFLDKGSMASAKQHLEVIEKFGRYPSRNEILGRESTPAELEYLRENPHGFSRQPPEAEA